MLDKGEINLIIRVGKLLNLFEIGGVLGGIKVGDSL